MSEAGAEKKRKHGFLIEQIKQVVHEGYTGGLDNRNISVGVPGIVGIPFT